MRVSQTLSRRRAIMAAGAGAAALTFAMTATARAQAGTATPEVAYPDLGPIPTGGATADGGWSFTDDRGVTVQADATPSKVVAYIGIAGALHDFGYEVAGFFSGESREQVDPRVIAPNLPFDTLKDFGYADTLDVEALVDFGADLLVGANYDVTGAQVIWPIPDDVMAQVEGFAGVVAIAFGNGTDTGRLIQTNENLAAALGADVTSDEVAASKAAFDEGAAKLRAATAAQPGLRALFMTGAPDGYYVGQDLADLNFYAQNGLETYRAETWDLQSWESIGDVDADVIFVDNRAKGWLQPDQLAEQVPTWPLLPAVQAGQVYPWQNEYVPSYTGFTPVMDGVATAVAGANLLD
ncbi:MAG: ABC transporter substrate-binding protein [Thermomicrobiales bacterium]